MGLNTAQELIATAKPKDAKSVLQRDFADNVTRPGRAAPKAEAEAGGRFLSELGAAISHRLRSSPQDGLSVVQDGSGRLSGRLGWQFAFSLLSIGIF